MTPLVPFTATSNPCSVNTITVASRETSAGAAVRASAISRSRGSKDRGPVRPAATL